MFKFPRIFVLHEETKRPMYIPEDVNKWPKEWGIVTFKEYPRMPTQPLPKPESLPVPFQKILESRRSRRNFNPESLSAKELSALLFWSSGVNNGKEDTKISRRFYPSGGALYPLEVYFYFSGNSQIQEGIYHYNVKLHAVEKLPIENPRNKILALETYEFVYQAPIFIMISAVLDRTMQKYRERGYRFAILEAGALLENFYMVSEALGLGCCAVGSIIDPEIEKMLEFEIDNEVFLAAIAVGKIKN